MAARTAGCIDKIKVHDDKKKNPKSADFGFFMAEKEGFEPSIPLWGIHDFQSCALGQLRDFSVLATPAADFDIILYNS